MLNIELTDRVAILMATYDGEEFLAEQIQSIIDQSYLNWKLLIRDDGSTDRTKIILSEFENRDSRISVYRDDVGNVGQCENFDILMMESMQEDYIMFADQDDIWEINKILISLKKIKQIEQEKSKKVPILVYTNYEVSNATLQCPKKVYSKNHKKNKKYIANRILVQNWIMGCTMIINNKLLRISLNIPKIAKNHDNWIALIASLTGEVGYLDEITMIHRLHENNVTTRDNTTSFSNRMIRTKMRFTRNNESFKIRKELQKEIAQRIESCMIDDRNYALEMYQKLLDDKGLVAVMFAAKNHFKGVNFVQTVLFYGQLLIKQ